MYKQAPFKALSLSHQRAPVEIRELIYLSPQSCSILLQLFQDTLGIQEMMVFSTCNRTEVYYVSEQDCSSTIIRLLCIEKQIPYTEELATYFDCMETEEAAAAHLFEVSMGLRSSVIGDLQISNQIKQAYSLSHDAGLAGPFLHRLMHTIFHANKRVQQETAYRDGAASVSYASAELAKEVTAVIPQPSVLVLGVGEMGRDVARNLDSTHFQQIHVANRTRSKAEALAQEIGATVIALQDISSHIDQYDVIISSLAVPTPFLNKAHFNPHHLANKFIIDLSVPRSIDANIEELPQVIVYNVDEIQAKTSYTLQKRLEAVPLVKKIIQESLHDFFSWRQQMSISPTIHKLKDSLEQIRKEELARFLKSASAKEAEMLEEVTKSLINKIVKLPVLRLKAACKRGEEESLIGVLNDLFNLDKVNA